MADELTVTIARVLERHHDVRTAGFGRWSECSCSPDAMLESEFFAHQADPVRAVLGETAAALRAELRGRIEGMFLGAPTRWVDGKECVDVPVSEFGELLAALTAQGVSE